MKVENYLPAVHQSTSSDTFTIPAAVTFSSTLTASSTLDVTGATTLSSTLSVTGKITASAGIESTAETLTANTDSGSGSSVTAGVTNVEVTGTTNDANDFIVLPSLSDVPVGHTITIACNAGTNFEMRTPADSGEKINNTDADGTNEYLCTDTDVVVCRKISDTDGWTAQSYQTSGAQRTAVTPD